MSQIDRDMGQIGARREALAVSFATPLHGALSARPTAAPWLPGALQALQATLRPALARIQIWHERARMRRQLAMLDDRLLRDIGITRLQARSEAEKPFWRV